ncbi:MAG TPA: hypothetical protein D7H87_03575, partial [Candidatus Poseidoniales archaeon]
MLTKALRCLLMMMRLDTIRHSLPLTSRVAKLCRTTTTQMRTLLCDCVVRFRPTNGQILRMRV